MNSLQIARFPKKKKKCEICGKVDNEAQARMWHFPADEERCRIWLKYVGNEDLVYIPIEKLCVKKKICSDHFLPQDFKESGSQLKKSAIPLTELKRYPLTDDIFAEFPYHLAKSYTNQNHGDVATGPKSSIASKSTHTTKTYNNNIHQDLIESWQNILCRGLTAPDKAILITKYKIPENCELLSAPSFNPRIMEILPQSLKAQDEEMKNNQQQLGLGIAAIGRVLSTYFSNIKNQDEVEAKVILSDACQILTDLHCMLSQQRLSILTYNESFIISENSTGK